MKKFMIFTLVTCLIMSSLIGCTKKESGESKEVSTQQQKSTESTAAPATEPVKEVTLKVTSWTPENKPAWEKYNESFGKENPGAKIDFSVIAGDQYTNVIKTKLLAGDGPDVYYYFGGSVNTDLAVNGLAADLTNEPFVERLVPFFKQFLTHSDNKIYSLPVDYSANGVFYNKAVFEKLNLQPPKNYAEFLALCDTIKKAGIEPIALGAKDSWTITNQFLPMYVSLTVAKKPSISFDLFDGKAKYTDPEFKATFLALDELVKKEYINKGLLGIDYQQSVTNLSEGKAAMIITGSFVLGTMAGINKDVKLGYFPFPAQDTDPAIFMNINQALVLNPKGNNLELSKKLITFLAAPENMKLGCEALSAPPCLKDVTPNLPDALADVNSNVAKYPGYVTLFTPGQVDVTNSNLINNIIAGEGVKDSFFKQMDKQLVEELKNPKTTKPVLP